MSIWQPPKNWLSPPRHWQLNPPAVAYDWLMEPGSLTTRLVALAQGQFRVELLSQYWGRPALEEAKQLRIPPQRYALIREVALLGHGVPWVRARSIIPVSSLEGAGQRLRKLGTRSLGHLLFRDPSLQRGDIQITQLMQPEGHVFARRSLLHYHGRPILVAECFLPALFAASHLSSKAHLPH